jgi:hypothetical protein
MAGFLLAFRNGLRYEWLRRGTLGSLTAAGSWRRITIGRHRKEMTMEIRPAQPAPGSPGASGNPAAVPKIVHQGPNVAVAFREPGSDGAPSAPPSTAAPASAPATGPNAKIRTFGAMKRHEDCWARTPNTTGSGAIHVKTFHAKLTEDSLVFLDQSINEWLDAHPQYEVKFVSTTIGEYTGKIKEPQLICMVWV